MNEMRTEDPDGALIRVAEAVSDGHPIDWDAEETTRPDLSGTLLSLRALEGVAQTHRGVDTGQSGIPAAWGSLEIREWIGDGGFADVYRAYDPALQSEVALKLRKKAKTPAESKDFLSEARKLAKVRHPNVLVVHGADEHDGRVGLWTELLRGETLEEMLASQGPFGMEEAVQIGKAVCAALAAVHAAGLVHCDVKTRNVMRAAGGRYVLTDFGSVSEFSESMEAGGASSAQGTPITMAPEQLRGERVAQPADIWGLGVLLYRLVSGCYPIAAASYRDLVQKHERKEITPLRDVRPDVSAAFARVVEGALSFAPDRRYPSAGAMEQALIAISGAPEPRPFELTAWLKRAAVPLAAAAMLAVVSVGLLVFHQIQGRMPWEPPKVQEPPRLAATVPAKLTATATLYRETGARVEALLPGSKIDPGDNLYLEILGSDSMYVYVLNEDEHGRVYALFPGPSFDSKGALGPGVTHRLPGTSSGTPVNWQVSSAGGRETVTVIASRRPQTDIERDIESIPKASLDTPIAYGAVSQGTLEVLRGIGGLTSNPTPPPAAGGGRVTKLIQEGRAMDLWTWQIHLINPGK